LKNINLQNEYRLKWRVFLFYPIKWSDLNKKIIRILKDWRTEIQISFTIVFNDNIKAIALYHRLGFKLDMLHPLEKCEKEDEIEWVDSINKIDRFFISMKL
jgi:hypothetical protein